MQLRNGAITAYKGITDSGSVTITGSLSVSDSITGSNALFTGTITAQTLVVQVITSSISYITGSTRFGSLLTDTHVFTGSVNISSSLTVVGDLYATASYAVSASFTNTAISASYVSGSAAIITNLTSSNDALINGVPIGKGLGSIATNIAIGRGALANFVAGANSNNTALGADALFSASSGNYNTAVGSGAMSKNGTGFQNTGLGSFVLYNNGSGSYNTAVGYSAMQLSTGSFNTAIGNLSMPQNTGSNNTVIGYQAMLNARSSTDNISIGQNSLGNARNANYNVSIGSLSLFNASGTGFGTSSYNIAIGYEAARRTEGASLFSSSYGVFIGTDVRPRQDNSHNEIVIGYQAIGSGSNTVSIGNSSVTITQLQGSVRTTGAFTGSLFGTSSWAQNTVSSSYAYTASSAISASYAPTITYTFNNGISDIGSNTIRLGGNLITNTDIGGNFSLSRTADRAGSSLIVSNPNALGTGITVSGTSVAIAASGSVNVIGQVSASGFTGSLFGTASQATALQNTGSTGFVSNMSDTYTGTAKITDIITLSAAEYSAIGAPLTSTLYIII